MTVNQWKWVVYMKSGRHGGPGGLTYWAAFDDREKARWYAAHLTESSRGDLIWDDHYHVAPYRDGETITGIFNRLRSQQSQTGVKGGLYSCGHASPDGHDHDYDCATCRREKTNGKAY